MGAWMRLGKELYLLKKSICTLSEPTHLGTHWYLQIINGITTRAAYHKLSVLSIMPEQLDILTPDDAPVLVIGATNRWLAGVLDRLSRLHLSAIVVGSDLPQAWPDVSVITSNQSRMSETAVRYLNAVNRHRLAYVGFNPFSLNDKSKLDRVEQVCSQLKLPFSPEDVFVFGGNMEQCIASFAERCEPYDCVLCTNDVAGLYLLKNKMLKSKKRIPDDLYVISFGNTLLSRLSSPTLTSISFNYRQMGAIAVNTVQYLRKNPEISYQHTSINVQIIPGASTGYVPAENFHFTDAASLPLVHESAGFYTDEGTRKVFQLETLFSSLDSIELTMVLMLLRGQRKNDIIDTLYISESTYKYRMRCICESAGVSNRAELLELLQDWIDPLQLENYLAQVN